MSTPQSGAYVSSAYRVGWTTLTWRRPHRPWQAEAEGVPCRFARRAVTPNGAVRKMRRDVDFYLRHGRQSPWQRQRVWRRVTRCRLGWHQWHDSLAWDAVGERFCPMCGLRRSPDSEAGR